VWCAVFSLKFKEAVQQCNLMKEEPNATESRKPYEAPKVVRISLRPEEAVLGNCKNSSSSGPVGGTCTNVSPCMSIGS
jgi:hypothetical protein